MFLKPVVNNGINYQPQLGSRISEPSTVPPPLDLPVVLCYSAPDLPIRFEFMSFLSASLLTSSFPFLILNHQPPTPTNPSKPTKPTTPP